MVGDEIREAVRVDPVDPRNVRIAGQALGGWPILADTDHGPRDRLIGELADGLADRRCALQRRVEAEEDHAQPCRRTACGAATDAEPGVGCTDRDRDGLGPVARREPLHLFGRVDEDRVGLRGRGAIDGSEHTDEQGPTIEAAVLEGVRQRDEVVDDDVGARPPHACDMDVEVPEVPHDDDVGSYRPGANASAV